MDALLFFSYFPFPPRAGCDLRVAQVTEGLQALGAQVTLVTHQQNGAAHHRPGRAGHQYMEQRSIAYVPIGFHPSGIQFGARHGRQARRQLMSIVQGVTPDVVWIGYANNDYLFRDVKATHFIVLDAIDVIGVQLEIARCLSRSSRFTLMYDFDRVQDHLTSMAHSARESKICDSYDTVVAIARGDQRRFSQMTTANVVYLPMHFEAVELHNTYSARPIFVGARNPMNLHACQLLAERVLAELGTYTVDVVGNVSALGELDMYKAYLRLLGMVEDLRTIYRTAPFMACPLVFGTGVKTKILEAMAHGVPVLALRHQVDSCPIVHGENGVVADSIHDFRTWFVRLWRDRRLCRTLGETARETMRRVFSRERFESGLRQVVARSCAPTTLPTSGNRSTPDSSV